MKINKTTDNYVAIAAIDKTTCSARNVCPYRMHSQKCLHSLALKRNNQMDIIIIHNINTGCAADEEILFHNIIKISKKKKPSKWI